MADLVKIKGLKGKQNKKKWAKNIDVSELLEARRQEHDAQVRQTFRPELQIVDDNDNVRPPLDPNRFKNKARALPKPKYDNTIVRDFKLNQVDDPWTASFQGKHKYKPAEVPSVIAPESGYSYNPREEDIQKLKDRIIDYQQAKPIPRKVKPVSQLPVVEVRHRNKKKRAAQLQARAREQQKERRRELNSLKKIKNAMEEKEKQIEEGIKTKKIVKEKMRVERLTGRVRKGVKLGRRAYKFKEYLPEGERPQKVSKVQLTNDLMKDRFDTIYRRGIFEPRSIKVHANRRKNIKVKERAFIE